MFLVTPNSSADVDNLHKIQNILEGIDFWDNLHHDDFGKSIRVMVPLSTLNSFMNIIKETQIEHELIIDNVDK